MAINRPQLSGGRSWFRKSFAHRALFDCATTFRLITPYMQELIQNSFQKEFRIPATGAPCFER